MSGARPLGLFGGFGIEAEYMIVDRTTLAARPISDLILAEVNGGEVTDEVEVGATRWSNELVTHVLEMKTNGPAADLREVPRLFAADVARLNALLARHQAMLMPTSMHPWFDPDRDTRLWPHGYGEVYAAYNRIFDCRGHGWSNVQSVHINLPFADDDEFGRLHAAIRLVLPLLPALAASSPVHDGRVSGLMDSRLEFYRQNQRRIPSITGAVIPEPAFSRQDYDRLVFQPIYRDIAPHDPEKILQDEWLNSRGAIARFQRDAIEIRVLDIQESARMDGAVMTAVVGAVMGLVRGDFIPSAEQRRWATEPLQAVFLRTLRSAGEAVIDDADYARAFGWRGGTPPTAAALWQTILARIAGRPGDPTAGFGRELGIITGTGCLARRILAALGNPAPGTVVARDRLAAVYGRLCGVLAEDGIFAG